MAAYQTASNDLVDGPITISRS